MGNPTAAYIDLLEKVILNEINPENGARIKYLLDLIACDNPQNGGRIRYLLNLIARDNPQTRDRDNVIAELVSLHRQHDPTIEALADLYAPRNWWTKTLGFPFSMIGRRRLRNLRWATETVIAEGIPGAMVETGVWRGGACILMKGIMRALDETRPLYVCDSFEGLPALDTGPDKDLNLNENPLLSACIEDVRAHFERLDLLDDDVHFVKGWFADTMAGVKEKTVGGISILRLDGDYYKSTMDVLKPLYPAVSPGGFVIIDDYFAYKQCKLATDEYRAANKITETIVNIDDLGVYWRVGDFASR